MSSKHADARNPRVDNHWAMTTWLTLYYTISVFVLLTAASAFLYSELERSMDQENRGYLRQKMQVLAQILQMQPLNSSGVEQEVREEAEISGRSQSPFFLRVLDAKEQSVAQPRHGIQPADVDVPNGGLDGTAAAALALGPPAGFSTSLSRECRRHRAHPRACTFKLR